MHVPDATINDILEKLPDGPRQEVINTLSGVNTHKIYCDSKVKGHCKNRHVGYFQEVNGQVRIDGFKDKDGEVFLTSWRPRMDGEYGLLCACGNDSRIAKSEEGEFDHKGNMPDKDGFNRIFKHIQNQPPDYPEIRGVKKVDGFRIERIA